MMAAFARAAWRATVVLAAASVVHAQSTPPSEPHPASPLAARLTASSPPPATPAPATRATNPPPFSVGERADYDVKFGILHVGGGSMEVAGVESLRGHDVWHTIFRFKGGTIFYHVNDVFESWFDQDSMSSLRFAQHLEEGGKVRNRDYVIYPDRAIYQLNDKPEQPSVSNPLDDGSFLYFVRTLPLKVGETYTFDRYFNPKSNPVTIKVLRRERISVPAGKFDAIVVQPIIKTAGIFSDRGEAQVWFSDDSARIVLQMKSKLSFGSLDLYLKAFHPGRGAVASVPQGAPQTPAGNVAADTVTGSPAADSSPPASPSSPSPTPPSRR
jgi:hypothetical protein